jgi:hypothetical protein
MGQRLNLARDTRTASGLLTRHRRKVLDHRRSTPTRIAPTFTWIGFPIGDFTQFPQPSHSSPQAVCAGKMPLWT